MTAHLDLDAARAARREAEGAQVSFVFGGETFTLPVEMPLEALDLVANVDPENDSVLALAGMMIPLMKAMLGDEWPRFTAMRPTMEDLLLLADHVWAAYGVDPTTPSQSAPSARATGKASRPRSKRTTGSTRAKSAGALAQ